MISSAQQRRGTGALGALLISIALPIAAIAQTAGSSAPPATPCPPNRTPGVYNRCALDEPPVFLSSNPWPAQPWSAGTIGGIYTLIVGVDGEVDSVGVASVRGGADFNESARETFRRWRFTPARRGSEAVATEIRLEVSTGPRNDTLPQRLDWTYYPGESQDRFWGVWVDLPAAPSLTPQETHTVVRSSIEHLVRKGALHVGSAYCILVLPVDSELAVGADSVAREALRGVGAANDHSAQDGCERDPRAARLLLSSIQNTGNGKVILGLYGSYPNPRRTGEERLFEYAWIGRCLADLTGARITDCSLQSPSEGPYGARLFPPETLNASTTALAALVGTESTVDLDTIRGLLRATDAPSPTARLEDAFAFPPAISFRWSDLRTAARGSDSLVLKIYADKEVQHLTPIVLLLSRGDAILLPTWKLNHPSNRVCRFCGDSWGWELRALLAPGTRPDAELQIFFVPKTIQLPAPASTSTLIARDPGCETRRTSGAFNRCALERAPVLLSPEAVPELSTLASSESRVDVVVAVDGTVDALETRFLSSSGDPAFDDRILETVRGWRFEPGRKAADAVRSAFVLTVAAPPDPLESDSTKLEWTFHETPDGGRLSWQRVSRDFAPLAQSDVDRVVDLAIRQLATMQVIAPANGTSSTSFCLVRNPDHRELHPGLSSVVNDAIGGARRPFRGRIDARAGCEGTPVALRLVLEGIHAVDDGIQVDVAGDYVREWPAGSGGGPYRAWFARCFVDHPESTLARCTVRVDVGAAPTDVARFDVPVGDERVHFTLLFTSEEWLVVDTIRGVIDPDAPPDSIGAVGGVRFAPSPIGRSPNGDRLDAYLFTSEDPKDFIPGLHLPGMRDGGFGRVGWRVWRFGIIGPPMGDGPAEIFFKPKEP